MDSIAVRERVIGIINDNNIYIYIYMNETVKE